MTGEGPLMARWHTPHPAYFLQYTSHTTDTKIRSILDIETHIKKDIYLYMHPHPKESHRTQQNQRELSAEAARPRWGIGLTGLNAWLWCGDVVWVQALPRIGDTRLGVSLGADWLNQASKDVKHERSNLRTSRKRFQSWVRVMASCGLSHKNKVTELRSLWEVGATMPISDRQLLTSSVRLSSGLNRADSTKAKDILDAIIAKVVEQTFPGRDQPAWSHAW